MTRPRLFVPWAVYHVYCRITRGEMVFARDGEPERLVAELQTVKQRDALTIYAFCVMSNHYHVQLRTADVPLWKTMLFLQASFAKGHNRIRGIRGPLWQSRYWARIVEDQEYFEQLLAYIHLNPVSAGLVEDPADYRWSGHNELLGLREPELVDIDQTLSSFGPTKDTAREGYLARVRLSAEAKWLRNGIRDLPWWSTVKNDEELVAPRYGRTYWAKGTLSMSSGRKCL